MQREKVYNESLIVTPHPFPGPGFASLVLTLLISLLPPPPPCRVIHVMNSPIFSLPALMLNPHTYHTNHLTYLKPPNHHKHIIHAVAHLLTGPE